MINPFQKKIDPAKEKEVVELAEAHPDWSGVQIAHKVNMVPRTVQKILKEHKLNRGSNGKVETKDQGQTIGAAREPLAEDIEPSATNIGAARGKDQERPVRERAKEQGQGQTQPVGGKAEGQGQTQGQKQGQGQDGPLTNAELVRLRKDEIIEIANEHPEWSGVKIAQHLHLNARYVQQLLKANSLNRTSASLLSANRKINKDYSQKSTTTSFFNKSNARVEELVQKEDEIIKLAKEHTDWSGARIAHELDFSARSVQRVLQKHNLSRNTDGVFVGNNPDDRPLPSFKKSRNITKHDHTREHDYSKGKPKDARVICGAVAKPHYTDLLPLNSWTYGVRMSPKNLRQFRESFDLPYEFMQLVVDVDGAYPEYNHFTGKNEEQYIFNYLLPASMDSLRDRPSIFDVNIYLSKHKSYCDYVAFATVEIDERSKNYNSKKQSDKYLTFGTDDKVYLIDVAVKKPVYVFDSVVELAMALY